MLTIFKKHEFKLVKFVFRIHFDAFSLNFKYVF
jgi:hypothetical protein